MSKTLTQAQLDSVKHLPSREAAKILGVGKSTINDYRRLARENGGTLPVGNGTFNHKVIHEGGHGAASSVEENLDGTVKVETQSDIPQTKDDVDQAMIKRGFDPSQYQFSYRFAEWEAQRGGGEIITMYAARASAVPIQKNVVAEALDVEELLSEVRNWSFTPVIKEEHASVDAVLDFADPQFGKTDEDGGTRETLDQIMSSFQNFEELVKSERPRHILFADLGDGLENFNNTSNQRETNDLDLTSQVRLLRRVQAEALRMFRPYCERLSHRSVPSNHGIVRIGPQQAASTPSNDWGLEVSHQLEDVFSESSIDVDFGRPEGKHAISLEIQMLSGTTIGMSHGDQAAQNQIAQWWMKQAFDWHNPLRYVDIFLYGHHHNHALEEVSRGRWAIGSASSDRGSAWFTNKTGRSATSGMTAFLTADQKFWDLQVV